MPWSPEFHLPCAMLCPQYFLTQGEGSGPAQPHSCLQSSSTAAEATTAGCSEASRMPGGCSLLGASLCWSYALFFIALSCSSTPCCFPELVSPPPLAAVRGCCEITFQKMEQTHLQQRDFKWAGKLVAALHKGDGVQSIIRSPPPCTLHI